MNYYVPFWGQSAPPDPQNPQNKATHTQGGGASLTQILLNGDWTNLGTFQRFYNRTVDDTPVGRLILEEANVSFGFIILNNKINFNFLVAKCSLGRMVSYEEVFIKNYNRPTK